MKKYLIVAKNTWDQTVTYRLNFVMWRVRVVLQILTIYFLWLAVLPKDVVIGAYDQPLILTYILGTSLITSFVMSSRSYEVGDEINEGNLSNFLIRPINYFLYQFARDMGDKAMNLVFCITELTIIFFILHPPLFIQNEPTYLLLSLLSALVALVMYFFINFLLGLIGFWSPEVWAPRFIFFILVTFFSGGLFPLDILPEHIFAIFKFLPFTYLLFFPLKIYLGQLSQVEILEGILISLIWTILLYFVMKFVWNRGLKIYTAYGK